MKKIFLGLLACGLPMIAEAQETFDALQMSQTELRGTARFQSMAGAFGALGGDISTLNQNPAGIGVYRSSDAGITLSLDFNSNKTPNLLADDKTRLNVNSVGYVGAFKLGSETMSNFNIGFSYSRNNDFQRHYRGVSGNIPTSITNHIAYYTGNNKPSDLAITDKYNPYYDSMAPWSSILSYDSYLINYNNGGWQGLYGDGTQGKAEYEVVQSGHTDEYSINLGGNFLNKVFWGAGVGIVDMNYDNYMYYGESLNNAYIFDYAKNDGTIEVGNANFGYVNSLHTTGTGYNFKLGLIVKPINELRLGAAFHTPTYYDMRDIYKTVASFEMVGSGNNRYNGEKQTGNGDIWDEARYTFSTPWRFIGSIAGVIGREGLVSFDYEYVGANSMRVGNDAGREYVDVTNRMKDYFQASHIFRLGGEYRVDPNWSVRAGYSYQTSPVKAAVRDNLMNITTVSSNPAYEYDKSVQYVTLGLGYHYKSFYADMAYVHKARTSVFNAFSPNVYRGGVEQNVNSEVKDNNNRVVMTMGFRF